MTNSDYQVYERKCNTKKLNDQGFMINPCVSDDPHPGSSLCRITRDVLWGIRSDNSEKKNYDLLWPLVPLPSGNAILG